MNEVFLRRAVRGAIALAATGSLAACTGAPAPQAKGSATASAPTSGFTVLTPAATADAQNLTWATYRETQTLDPIKAFDYPENAVDPLLCDSLLRQNPDMTIGDGLAKVTTTTPTQYDFQINAAATFWDGSPVTAQDAVFSLKRAAAPDAGGYYTASFDRVSSIKTTGAKTFRITLKKPDYWLLSELSATPGEVLKQAYVQSKGDRFGTVNGGTMCSGPFKLDSWKTGQGVKLVPNTGYWDTSQPKPRLTSLTIIGAADDATLTAGIKTGSISGGYPMALSTLGQLKNDPAVNVYQGAPFATASMVVSATKGPLADPKIRKALSYAIDRQGIINTVFKGAANLPHAIAPPGTWGYAKDTFTKAYSELPEMTQDLAKAKELATQANAAGQTITLGTSSGIPTVQTETLAVKAAAEAIGLKVKLNNVSPANFINFFTDPKAYGSVDMFPTMNYPDYADPAALYRTFALPSGTQNFNRWSNADVTRYLDAARGESDPAKRAEDVVAAQKIITEQLTWIPLAAPNTVLIMNKAVTGAPATFQYMFGPWAVHLGGTGK
ncbi:ABC transporter substrate-binding protein [Streptomyces sp. NPDC051016]|uniref:ABC transporter substrate-binding protein n=2 Tax=unclassified Streptomyces TaxID=2593676 RepID=UPI003790D235